MKNSSALGLATMSLREKISRAAEAFVDIKVQNLPLQFYLSTLTGLADLVEDEIIPTPIPMKVGFQNNLSSMYIFRIVFTDSTRKSCSTFGRGQTEPKYNFSWESTHRCGHTFSVDYKRQVRSIFHSTFR